MGPDSDELFVGFDVSGDSDDEEFDNFASPKYLIKTNFTLVTPESLPLLVN